MRKSNPIIVFGTPAFDMKTLKDPDVCVTSLYVDRDAMVNMVVQAHGRIHNLTVSMQEAQSIGLINLEALTPFFR